MASPQEHFEMCKYDWMFQKSHYPFADRSLNRVAELFSELTLINDLPWALWLMFNCAFLDAYLLVLQ